MKENELHDILGHTVNEQVHSKHSKQFISQYEVCLCSPVRRVPIYIQWYLFQNKLRQYCIFLVNLMKVPQRFFSFGYFVLTVCILQD